MLSPAFPHRPAPEKGGLGMGKGPSAAGEPPLLPGVAAGQTGRFSFVPWQVTRAYRSMLLTSIETQKGGPARNPLSHLILGIEKRTPAETLMSVNPSAHKSRYIQLSSFTQGRLRRSLAHITTVLFATSFSCRSLCFALNFSLTSVREAIKMR